MGAPGRVLNATTRRRSARILCAALASVAGWFFAPTEALAAGNLASVVLTNTFPGMVAAPAGGNNGPLGSNLGYLPVDTAVGAKLLLALGTGGLSGGYFRAWSRQPANGDSVFIFAIRYKSSTTQVSWLKDVDAGLQGEPGVSTFAVPGISGADGFTVHPTTSAGTPSTANVVTFAKGGTIFILMIASPPGDLTSADAASLATRQAANAPSSTSSKTKDYEIGGAAGAALLVVLIVMTVRRRRRYRPMTNTFQPNTFQTSTSPPRTVRPPSVSPYPPLPIEPKEPGWTAIGDSEWYWDGRAWTDRRQLTPTD